MWFKNLVLYRFQQTFAVSSDTLEKSLDEHPFRPCGKTELSSWGWVPAVPGGKTQVHVSGPFWLIAARKEEKILPGSVIRDAVNEKVEALEKERDGKVSRKEKKAIKEEVTLSLLPKAFTRSQTTWAMINKKEGWLMVDAGSFKQAEELTSSLRSCLGSLPLLPPSLKCPASDTMSAWLDTSATTLPTGFALGDECELRDRSDDGAIIRCKNQDLLAEEMTNHLNAGMEVSRLQLHWEGGISCVVGEDLLIRRLKFSETLQTDQGIAHSKAEQFDADFTLMAMTVQTFVAELLNALGGEQEKRGEMSESGAQTVQAPLSSEKSTSDTPFCTEPAF